MEGEKTDVELKVSSKKEGEEDKVMIWMRRVKRL